MTGQLLRTRSLRSFKDLGRIPVSKSSGQLSKLRHLASRRKRVSRVAVLLLLVATFFFLTLGPSLPLSERLPAKTRHGEREPLHRKFAREALASLRSGGASGGALIEEKGLERDKGQFDGGVEWENGTKREAAVEARQHEKVPEAGSQMRGPSNGSQSGGSRALPLVTNPIIMYPELLRARQVFLTSQQDHTNFVVSPNSLWEEPLRIISETRSCKKLDDLALDTPEVSSGYLLVDANGGLNQQRISVCNAVAVARLLNACLVIPRFLLDSVWLDGSQFQNIFNLNHFIRTLAPDVRIVTEAPDGDWAAMPETAYSLRVPKYSPPEYYLEHGAPLLKQYGVLKLAGYMHGLGFREVPAQLQKLRCRANFKGLKLAPSLQAFGDLLVERIRAKSGGPFLALHLRFEKDMVADTCCDYGGGEGERADLQAYRRKHFPALAKKYETMTDADELRAIGHCPLTPEELGLLLAGLGYDNKTVVYIAAGEVYGGARRMAVFEELFPRSFTKRSLASAKELAPFAAHTSQLAALDTYVAEQSDVFAYGHTGSNFPKIVSGLRLYSGQRRTVAPYKKKLATLFERARKEALTWKEFSRKVRKIHPPRKVSAEFGKNLFREPIPDCLCESAKSRL